MKLNNRQKRILYISILGILLMSLYSKKYILPEYRSTQSNDYVKIENS